MRAIGENCVNCEVCCGCGRNKETTYNCDECGHFAQIHYNGKDYCKECFEELLEEEWKNLSLIERADTLGLYYEEIEY